MNLEKIKNHNLAGSNSFASSHYISTLGVLFLVIFLSVSLIISYFADKSLATSFFSIEAKKVQAKTDTFNNTFSKKRDFPAAKEQITETSTYPKKVSNNDPPELDSESIIVKDHNTGKILFRKNSNKERPMASITKLMSALVFLETKPNWDKKISVTQEDIIGSHVDSGEIYTINELWQAALIGSSNKSIFSLAQSVGWPKQAFIQRMNQKASELGMDDTYFVGTTGLDEKNVSTAEDITILLNSALQKKKIQSTLGTDEYTLDFKENSHHIWNTNWLLLDWIPNDFERVYGGKTGHIEAAGYNFTVQISQDGKILDVVVLGANSHEQRFTIAREAAEWVYDNYEWRK